MTLSLESGCQVRLSAEETEADRTPATHASESARRGVGRAEPASADAVRGAGLHAVKTGRCSPLPMGPHWKQRVDVHSKLAGDVQRNQ